MRQLRRGAGDHRSRPRTAGLLRGRGEVGPLPVVDRARYDLWRYAALLEPRVPVAFRLSIGEGWTPAVEMPVLAAELGLERLVLKREDLSPTGSHKARGLCFQVSAELARRSDLDWLTISSSGNAAIAAAAYCAAAGVQLAAFLTGGTPPEKLHQVVRLGATVFVADRALTLAEALAAARGVPNLRPSVHPEGATGFQTIAWELVESCAPVEALFIFSSSASGLVGIGRAFARATEVMPSPWRPALHVVQGCGTHPIAGIFDHRPPPAPAGRLGALGARKTRRLGEAVRLVRASGGSGWVISDEEAFAAAQRLAAHGIDTSLEGAAALAAADRAAREAGVRSALVVLTGARRGAENDPPVDGTGVARVHHVRTLDEVLAVLDRRPVQPPIDAGALTSDAP